MTKHLLNSILLIARLVGSLRSWIIPPKTFAQWLNNGGMIPEVILLFLVSRTLLDPAVHKLPPESTCSSLLVTAVLCSNMALCWVIAGDASMCSYELTRSYSMVCFLCLFGGIVVSRKGFATTPRHSLQLCSTLHVGWGSLRCHRGWGACWRVRRPKPYHPKMVLPESFQDRHFKLEKFDDMK